MVVGCYACIQNDTLVASSNLGILEIIPSVSVGIKGVGVTRDRQNKACDEDSKNSADDFQDYSFGSSPRSDFVDGQRSRSLPSPQDERVCK